VRRVSKNGANWSGKWRSRHDFKKLNIDLSAVTHDRPLILPKPEFLSKIKGKDDTEDLVFYRPGTSSIFYLKSLGDGEFEVIHTEVDFENRKTVTTRPVPKRTYLAKHTVRAGESLSSIAYKYYQSWIPEMWKRIYEANKNMIGKNPIRPNMVLTIPFKDGPIHNIGPRG
jgi:nucleoid-associated protein YgaU